VYNLIFLTGFCVVVLFAMHVCCIRRTSGISRDVASTQYSLLVLVLVIKVLVLIYLINEYL